jgi:hypothetical protein
MSCTQGQKRGEIDRAIDPDTAAAVLICIMDALRALALRYPGIGISKATDVFKLLTTRFLSEGIAKGARSRKTRLESSTVHS